MERERKMSLIAFRSETGSTCFGDIQCVGSKKVCLALKVVYRRSVIPPHAASSKTHNPGSCSTKHGIGAELKLPAAEKKPQSFFPPSRRVFLLLFSRAVGRLYFGD